MRRIGSRTYLGGPNETVNVVTRPSGGGRSTVIVDGQLMGPTARFPLPATPGAQKAFQVALSGPLRASCTVTITVVDGGSDGDFLMCQPHNPAPINNYTCTVAAAGAMRAIAAGGPRTAAPPAARAAKRTKANGAKRKAAKKAAARKPASRKGGRKGGRK